MQQNDVESPVSDWSKIGLLFGRFSNNWLFMDESEHDAGNLAITSMTVHHALYMTCILREKSTSRKECFLQLLKLTSSHYIHSVHSLTCLEDRCKTSSILQATCYLLLLLEFMWNAKIMTKFPEICSWKKLQKKIFWDRFGFVAVLAYKIF